LLLGRDPGGTLDPATRILVLGALWNLAFAFAIGFVLARRRRRTAEPSRYLLLAHRVSLWWGFLLLGMPWAVLLSALPAPVEAIGALLLVASSLVSAIEPLVNLAQGVEDAVAERSIGYYLAGAAGMLATAGLLPFMVGSLLGL
jgi:hypothetical protein